MATQTATQAKTNTEQDFTRADLTRTLARLKIEVGGLVDDARRRSPYFAKSREEAIAKRNAAVRVLEEFADRIDMLKKENA